MVANEVLVRQDISWKAKGVYAYLFSKPDGWDFSADRIAKEGKESRKTVLTALKELESVGYLNREKLPNGRVVYDIAFSETQSAKSGLRVSDPKSQKGTMPKVHGAKTEPISNTVVKSNTDKEVIQKGGDVGEIIESFRVVNPSVNRLFANKTQRAAVDRLLKQYGIEKLKQMVAFLEHSNSQRYAPTITTPLQLEIKMGELKAWADKQRSTVSAGKGKAVLV